MQIRTRIKRDLRATRTLPGKRLTVSRRKFKPGCPTEKASQKQQAQACCTKRRRIVYKWFSSLSSFGEISPVPREQRRTSTEFRLSNLHPTIRVFVSATTLALAIHYKGRCWDVLSCFEKGAEKVPGGWANPFSAPEQQRIYSSVDAMWKAEVFDTFCEWFVATFNAAQALILYATRDGSTWAQLLPNDTPVGLYEMARFPVWIKRGIA